jgi:hypothetical protein
MYREIVAGEFVAMITMRTIRIAASRRDLSALPESIPNIVGLSA